MKLIVRYCPKSFTVEDAQNWVGAEVPAAPNSPCGFAFGDDTVVLVMNRATAENMYEQGHDNFDGCSDWEEFEDALAEVGIGKKDYTVDVQVFMSTIVNVGVCGARNEDEAGEQAIDAFRADMSAYLVCNGDPTDWVQYGDEEIYDITEE